MALEMTGGQGASPAISNPPWSFVQIVVFRFVFVFFLLHLEIFAARLLPGYGFTSSVWNWCAAMLAHLVGFTIAGTQFTGSSDTSSAWFVLASQALAAVIVAVVWSAIQRKPTRHPILLDILQLYVRVVLYQALLVYGAVKVLGLQFPAPDVTRLTETYGNSSPMGLMWTFMGASLAYQQFGGIMEVIAALLLVFRRTTTLGAALSAGVMGNVFVMNLCYDVPVKIGSGTLVVLSIFLVALDAPRLVNVFLLNRPTEPAPYHPEFWTAGRWLWARYALVWVLMGSGLVFVGGALSSPPHKADPKAITAAFQVVSAEGVEEVSKLAVATNFSLVIYSDGREQRVRTTQVGAERRVTLSGLPFDPEFSANLVWSEGESNDEAVATGTWNNAPVTLRLKAMDLSKNLLMNRGFRLISEHPYNRLFGEAVGYKNGP